MPCKAAHTRQVTPTSVSKLVDRQTQRSLRRDYAQVWECWDDGGQIFIKDVESSNVIQAEDNKTRKLQPELYAYLPNKTSKLLQYGPSSFNSTVDFRGAPQQRRTQIARQGLMGGDIRPPGKSGLSFDLILRRLQGELQKSKDTGAELHNLTTVLSEMQATLGGSSNMPPPPFPHVTAAHNSLSPDREPRRCPPPLIISPETLLEMQAQLQHTQSFLASHADKIQLLECIFVEQDSLNQEIDSLNQEMRALRSTFKLMEARELYLFQLVTEREKDDEDGEEDDIKSISSVTAGEDNMERGEEHMGHRDISDGIPEHDLKMDEEEHRRREELGRPKTAEPTIGIDTVHAQNPFSSSRKVLPSPPDINPIKISERVSPLSEQVKAMMAVKLALEAQQAMIQALEKKVKPIEALVKDTQEHQTNATVPLPPPFTIPILVTPPSSVEIAKEKEAETSLLVTEILSEWTRSVQEQWSSVQEDWSEERERLSCAREELEAKMRKVDAGLEKIASLETSAGTVKEMQMHQGQQLSVLQVLVTRIQQQAQLEESGRNASWFREHDGGIVEAIKHRLSGGLVTPPSSPRSQSSDSPRRRRSEGEETGVGGVHTGIDAEGEGEGGEGRPGSSVLRLPHVNAQATFGVLVLSIAAAAVIWHVKPE
ncbi:hypothetical protein M378DRAFT_16292 [Amanita muscaria Koide BX008]|uniref:Uncharacterized protein n=1 Tax=Amanita muscaria (strain Koide BX008) TaxID=946122 RepID=A0A0C2W883_AMAMK|nr:hypothetical protein M378DRAFT_16292 [Amanita muscaria Koide BX008]